MIDLGSSIHTRRIEISEIESLNLGTFIHGISSDEERANVITDALTETAGTLRIGLSVDTDSFCTPFSEKLDAHEVFSLYDHAGISGFTASLTECVAIDLTSLEHRVWAPLVKTLIAQNKHFVAVYAEPDDYTRAEHSLGSIYDLSTHHGIEPLPGFAKLSRRPEESGNFAPLLGFEGARLSHIFDQEEVESTGTYPILGAPGFRIEYPALALVANRATLEMDRMEDRMEFATASCPFSAFDALHAIHKRIDDAYLRIAPIGTKPHALGAVIYAICHPGNTELIYDHPRRSPGRSTGHRALYVYQVSEFILNRRNT
ncbi:hypothetical protein [Pseudoclavibacter sp. RFBB5]|uniref:hypothetical protein n=1 Tax=Pseudoclavibacter sp. RFBB5 TaxID=2080574 RepID=UPI0011AFF03A|nr:hypothetical protein [Pseudoclavibacter sp. RFBB5]